MKPHVFYHGPNTWPLDAGQFHSDSILVNDEGEIVSRVSNSASSPGSGSPGGTSSVVPSAGSGNAVVSPFVINITYDSSTVNAPAAFKTAIDAAVQYLESQFTDAVTINITVGYGSINGTPLGSGAL